MTELVIAFTELMEAEGRALRRGAVRTGAGVALAGLAALLGLVGLGLLLWALFRGFADWWGEVPAAVATGSAALIAAGILAWAAKRTAR